MEIFVIAWFDEDFYDDDLVNHCSYPLLRFVLLFEGDPFQLYAFVIRGVLVTREKSISCSKTGSY